MPARNPHEAVERVRAALQRVVSTVSSGVLRTGGHSVEEGQVTVYFGGEGTARLRLRSGLRLRLSIQHQGRIVRSAAPRRAFQFELTGYNYRILTDNGAEILGYHWHPIGNSPVKAPHLHIWGEVKDLDVSGAHFPTPRISLQHLIRQAITELGVEEDE